MPDAKIYRWEDLEPDHPLARLDRKRIIGEKMMISQVVLHEGCHVPTHAHENEQFACVVSGEVRFGIGADESPARYEVTVCGGGVLHLPSNVPHSADAVKDSLVLDLFSPPSEKTGVDARGR